MRIAFISHEFPPETGGGGIGTYLAQISRQLAAAGHEIFVFAGGDRSSTSRDNDGINVHRIACTSSQAFGPQAVEPFSTVHKERPFDVMEGNDFDASALAIKLNYPRLPYVCKLHTPRFVIDELHRPPPNCWSRLRMYLGALRRGENTHPIAIRNQPPARAELDAILRADEIAAPSEAIAVAAQSWMRLDRSKISIFSYPYAPAEELLKIPARTSTNRITFLGRLEERKGVIDLAHAIPLVLKRKPTAQFRFVGRSMRFLKNNRDMKEFLEAKLSNCRNAVEFTGPLPPGQIPPILAETDILAAPSHWESFGLVCCEGLAAARSVIGSSAGGMLEILDQGRCGKLVDPHRPDQLAQTIVDLLDNPEERCALGEAGRQRILENYSPEYILALQLASYRRAIERCPRATHA